MPRILLIDDDDMVRVAISAMLQKAGHEVAVAVDGIDGLDQIERQDFDSCCATSSCRGWTASRPSRSCAGAAGRRRS
jgi:DNA-binding NtrC family response regulator